MSIDYKASMARAEECKQNIQRFRATDDPVGTLDRRSFASKIQREWIDLVRCYQEALGIYLDLNRLQETQDLLTSLLELVEICDERSGNLAIQLLLSLGDSIERVDTVVPGTKGRVSVLLRRAIGQKMLGHELDYWLLRRALELSRSLVDNETDRRTVNIALCQVMELAAQVFFSRGNLDGAEGWYREAAQIAQERVGDTDWASRLLQEAANINFMRSQRTPVPDSNEASSTTSIADDLSQIPKRAVDELHQERFLPTVDEFQKEYADAPDKLGKLVADDRLVLDRTVLEARASKYRGKGLLAIPHNLLLT